MEIGLVMNNKLTKLQKTSPAPRKIKKQNELIKLN